jgi:hypothetical protein
MRTLLTSAENRPTASIYASLYSTNSSSTPNSCRSTTTQISNNNNESPLYKNNKSPTFSNTVGDWQQQYQQSRDYQQSPQAFNTTKSSANATSSFGNTYKSSIGERRHYSTAKESPIAASSANLPSAAPTTTLSSSSSLLYNNTSPTSATTGPANTYSGGSYYRPAAVQLSSAYIRTGYYCLPQIILQ